LALEETGRSFANNDGACLRSERFAARISSLGVYETLSLWLAMWSAPYQLWRGIVCVNLAETNKHIANSHF
jgi:hypothetical protein